MFKCIQESRPGFNCIAFDLLFLFVVGGGGHSVGSIKQGGRVVAAGGRVGAAEAGLDRGGSGTAFT